MGTGKLFRIWRNKETGRLTRERVDDNSESLPIVVDSETKIIYYKFSEYMHSVCTFCNSEFDTKIGFMTPYLSENGKICRFIGGQIIEIN